MRLMPTAGKNVPFQNPRQSREKEEPFSKSQPKVSGFPYLQETLLSLPAHCVFSQPVGAGRVIHEKIQYPVR